MFNELFEDKLQKIGALNLLCLKDNLQITRRKAIKINDNGQYFDFIGDTLNYVTHVMSKEVKIIFSEGSACSI